MADSVNQQLSRFWEDQIPYINQRHNYNVCPWLGHIKKLVGDHPFCFKEVSRADGVSFLNWYECGREDKNFIYFRTCI